MTGFGTAEEHAQAVAPVREACAPLFEFVSPLPYTQLQQMLDADYPWGVRGYDKALVLTELTDDAITVMTERAEEKRSHATFLPIFALHGAVAEVDSGRHGLRRHAHAALRRRHLRHQRRPGGVRGGPGLGPIGLGRPPPLRRRRRRLRQLHLGHG